jgi:hypothetical protein
MQVRCERPWSRLKQTTWSPIKGDQELPEKENSLAPRPTRLRRVGATVRRLKVTHQLLKGWLRIGEHGGAG